MFKENAVVRIIKKKYLFLAIIHNLIELFFFCFFQKNRLARELSIAINLFLISTAFNWTMKQQELHQELRITLSDTKTHS